MRAAVHAVLHDEAARHRAGPRDRAVRGERSRRTHLGGERGGRRHVIPYRTSQTSTAAVGELSDFLRLRKREREGSGTRKAQARGVAAVAPKANILIIDDDANTLASLARAFRLANHEATVCDNAARALELAKAERFDLILSDVVMPGKDGIALLEELKNIGVASPTVMMSGQATIEMAVKATRLGAIDFLEKPISTEKLLLTVENALRLRHLEDENCDLKRRLGRHFSVWASAAMREVMAQVEKVAAGETRVCIRGETGTGKELVARTLHEKSGRRNGPFISLNCAAIPAELMESELFGHEKGSFTGAATRHMGKFEQAHGGTLFLD